MRWSVTFVNHLSLALIAFSRFIMLKYPTIGKKIFSGRAAKVPLLSVWIIVVAGVAMNLSGVGNLLRYLPGFGNKYDVFQDITNYGYDCQVGYCSMFRHKPETKRLRLIQYAVGILFPFSTIFCCNVGLWSLVRTSSKYLRDSR